MTASLMVLAIMAVGLLVIIQVFPARRILPIIGAIIVCGIFMPMVFPPVFFDGGSPWWKYVLFIVAVLIGIRMIFDRIFPWRRRY